MAFAVEAQFDSVVAVAVAQHAVGNAAVNEHVDGAVLQDAGPDRFGNLLVTPKLDDGGFDAGLCQQMGQHEPGRAGTHDRNLGGDDFSLCHVLLASLRGPGGQEPGTGCVFPINSVLPEA